MLEILPELKALEAETLDMLLGQAEQHARYEKAARELVSLEVAKVEEAHEREVRSLRLQSETDQTRSTVGAEMRMKAQEDAAREEQEQLVRRRAAPRPPLPLLSTCFRSHPDRARACRSPLALSASQRAEAIEKIGELEEEVAKLEGQLDAQKTVMSEMKDQHKEECDELVEEREKILQAFEDAQNVRTQPLPSASPLPSPSPSPSPLPHRRRSSSARRLASSRRRSSTTTG